MVRISKKQPTEKVLAIMNEQFIKHIARIGIPKEAEHFFHEMFTQAEQTMYMKRFAILVMLERGYSFSVIRCSLRVSQTTISRVQNARNKNLFDRTALHIGRRLKKTHKNDDSNFFRFLDVLLRAGLPPQGKGRWKYVWDMMERDERKRQARLARRR